jgi:hypothetical protein
MCGQGKKLMEAARLWASGDLEIGNSVAEPSEQLIEAATGFGLVMDRVPVVDEDIFWLWPENEQIWQLWLFVQTLWVTDQGVRTGLNYAGVEVCMRHRPIPRGERNDWFVSLQGMEIAALAAYAAQR